MDLSALLWMIAAGGGTTLGALVLLVWRNPSDAAFDLALGAGAGIMLAATVLGLLPAATDAGPFLAVMAGFALGAIALAGADRLLPHVHARFAEGRDQRASTQEADHADHDRFAHDDVEILALTAGNEKDPARWSRGVLLTGAIALHNFPEGMAIGIAFATGNGELGIALAIAILIHNLPEGLAVAMPLRSMGFSLKKTIWWTTLTGLIEIIGALIGYALANSIESLLPYGLGFAAGAMLYVIIDEMVPAAHTRGEQRASLIFIGSFLIMAAIMHYIGALITTATS